MFQSQSSTRSLVPAADGAVKIRNPFVFVGRGGKPQLGVVTSFVLFYFSSPPSEGKEGGGERAGVSTMSACCLYRNSAF